MDPGANDITRTDFQNPGYPYREDAFYGPVQNATPLDEPFDWTPRNNNAMASKDDNDPSVITNPRGFQQEMPTGSTRRPTPPVDSPPQIVLETPSSPRSSPITSETSVLRPSHLQVDTRNAAQLGLASPPSSNVGLAFQHDTGARTSGSLNAGTPAEAQHSVSPTPLSESFDWNPRNNSAMTSSDYNDSSITTYPRGFQHEIPTGSTRRLTPVHSPQILFEPPSPRSTLLTPGGQVPSASPSIFSRGPEFITPGTPLRPSHLVVETRNVGQLGNSSPTSSASNVGMAFHHPTSTGARNAGSLNAGLQVEAQAPATPISHPSWTVVVYSQTLEITSQKLQRYHSVRSQLLLESQLNDLLAGSLVPLTYQHPPHNIDKIAEQATLFFSSFQKDAHWHTDVDNLPHHVGKVIYGLTPNSRDSKIGPRFMRFRFPYVDFEWFVQTPYSKILVQGLQASGGGGLAEVEVLWKAWARVGAASGLVAYGSIKDTIQVVGTGRDKQDLSLLIANRRFIVTQVFQPELMTPMPYHRERPPLSRRMDVLIFSTSWTVIQFLRSSMIQMGFLIALSALFAALQPIVKQYTAVGAWILTGFGVLSGLISVAAVSFGWLLTRIEAQTAKRQQNVQD